MEALSRNELKHSRFSHRHLALGRPYPFKFFKGCLPQILLGPFLNTLSHLLLQKQPQEVFCKIGVLKNSSVSQSLFLKVQSYKSCNNKYMITSKQIANTEMFEFLRDLVFKLLRRKV